MITEDYVSFEIAKLLKEKGFDEPCHCFYEYKKRLYNDMDKYFPNGMKNSDHDKEGNKGISAPTLQMAMKWLREVHGLFIEIMVGESEGKTWYDYDILPVNGKFIYWKELNVLPPTIECNTPEEAIEMGLKYCLENLI